MAAVAGMAVSTAGSIGGGIAGKAFAKLMAGSPIETEITNSKTGKSSEGIDVAKVTGGTSKDPKNTFVAQSDITKSLQWFSQAATELTDYNMAGLQRYNDVMTVALQEVKAGYKEAIDTLKPTSYAGTQAINEMTRFMGMDPISSSTEMAAQAKDLGLPMEIQNKIMQAEGMKDPAQRAAAKNDIMDAITGAAAQNDAKTQLQYWGAQQAKLNANTASLIKGGQYYQEASNKWANRGDNGGSPEEAARMLEDFKPKDGIDYYERINKLKQNENDSLAIQQMINGYSSASQAKDLQNQQFQSFLQTFNQKYADSYDKGYTGAEVQAKLEATPGYQFQMQQGLLGIDRAAAAKGNLLSGNTLISANNYAQGQALSYFNSHMDNLNKIAALGQNASSNIATLQSGQGTAVGGLLQDIGKTNLSTYQNIGQGRANQWNLAADTYAKNAQSNAALIAGTMNNNNNNQTELQKAAMQQQRGQQGGGGGANSGAAGYAAGVAGGGTGGFNSGSVSGLSGSY